jgi:phosphate uptake regulator
MGRSPSRSSDGADSGQNARVEPRLLKAIEDKKHDDAIAIIEHAKAKSQPVDHLLRIGLMRAAERGNIYITEYSRVVRNPTARQVAGFRLCSKQLRRIMSGLYNCC